MRSFFSRWFSHGNSKRDATATSVGTLDYEQLIHLDAEDLAEQGIAEAYERLLPELAKHMARPAKLVEVVDNELPSYKVQCDGHEYLIWSAEEPGTEQEGWGRATYFFFLLVNRQLAATHVRFYAFYGGNDLSGMFLTRAQAEGAQAGLLSTNDWPYIPELSEPWYGQFH